MNGSGGKMSTATKIAMIAIGVILSLSGFIFTTHLKTDEVQAQDINKNTEMIREVVIAHAEKADQTQVEALRLEVKGDIQKVADKVDGLNDKLDSKFDLLMQAIQQRSQ